MYSSIIYEFSKDCPNILLYIHEQFLSETIPDGKLLEEPNFYSF
jgi:hypothetical protein